MESIAQTNIQLYNQMQELGYDEKALAFIYRVYTFTANMYSGYYQADGKPFVAHCVGISSILAQLNMPADIIAAGLVHNIYGDGDFGDGRRHFVNRSRRTRVRDEVGGRIEELVFRFRKMRLKPETIDYFLDNIDSLNESDKDLLIMDLADCLEKYVDLGVLYYGDNLWLTETVKAYGDKLSILATNLGQPKLAHLLADAVIRAQNSKIPDVLRMLPDSKYTALVIPGSCRRRMSWFRGRAISLLLEKFRKAGIMRFSNPDSQLKPDGNLDSEVHSTE